MLVPASLGYSGGDIKANWHRTPHTHATKLFHPPEQGAAIKVSVRDLFWLTPSPEIHLGISQPKAAGTGQNHAEEHTNT